MRSLFVVAMLALLAIVPVQALASVAVNIGFNPATACPGTQVQFFSSLENTGAQSDIVNFSLTIAFDGQTYGPFPAQFRLAAGQTISKEVDFTIPPQTPAGTLTVTVTASDSSGPSTSTASLQVQACGQTGAQSKQLPTTLSRELKRQGVIQ